MPPTESGDRLLRAIIDAIAATAEARGITVPDLGLSGASTVAELEHSIAATNLPPDAVFAHAALGLTRTRLNIPSRVERESLEYLVADLRPPAALAFTSGSSLSQSLSADIVMRTTIAANRTIELVHDLSIANNVPIFHLLGLRNLSSFVGEIFARELCLLTVDTFLPNPNQDGYPDLCALTQEGRAYVAEKEARGQMSAKEFWSPFPFGGVEVKATCGNTPSARHTPKPRIGEPRVPILVSAEWKAHHRETNNLLGIFWDFVEGLPTILAAFYRNDLTTTDWGEIVQPHEGGGRTTSVSIMNRTGVKKMGQGWVILPARPDLRDPISRDRVFAVTENDLRTASSSFRPRSLRSKAQNKTR